MTLLCMWMENKETCCFGVCFFVCFFCLFVLFDFSEEKNEAYDAEKKGDVARINLNK